LLKILHGGWVPLLIGVIGFTLMTTWRRGRRILAQRLRETGISWEELQEQLEDHELVRVPGTAVFMSGDPNAIPPALSHNIEHNKVLHESVIFLSVIVRDEPRVPPAERVEVHNLDNGFYRVCLYYGFMEDPHVPRDLNLARLEGLEFDALEISYFLGRERILASSRPGMTIWREHLFSLMSRNSRNATDFFRLPPSRVVELGAQVEI
jgi:KUP system potassium uptake protein